LAGELQATGDPTQRWIGRVLRSILRERVFAEHLANADQRIVHAAPRDVPGLFDRVPLDVFGLLLLELPDEYPNIKRYFPQMPPDELQRSWVGASGETLLNQSVAAVKSFVAGYREHVGRPIAQANVLDYGCGWGRLLRLFYKYVPDTGLYGVDASPQILDVARELRVRGQLALIDEYPEALPFRDTKFDFIYCFSVLTHLSRRAQAKSLALWHRYLADDGLIAATIRPRQYWAASTEWKQISASDADEQMTQHDVHGFAYKPHNRPSIGGDIPYGDASVDIDYIRRNWHGWEVASLDYSLLDPLQVIVFLKKRRGTLPAGALRPTE
jgi:SAM-dependent methyltransferase